MVKNITMGLHYSLKIGSLLALCTDEPGKLQQQAAIMSALQTQD